jgi:hypothetical protein
VAHWITFKEEQRLDWQQKYLTQLCEADQEIQEASELVTDFTSMLRERQGERLDAWLEKVETRGIVELKNFAEASKKRLRCGESWPHTGVEQRPDRGPGPSTETHKEANVWPRSLRSPTQASSETSLEKALQASSPLIHQKSGRVTSHGEVSKYSSVLWLFSFAQLTDEFLSFKPFFAPFHRLMGSYLCDTGPNICDNKQFTQNGDYPHGIRNELEASKQ